jgi:hypothetical protein
MRGIGLSIGSPHSSASGAAPLVSYPRIFARLPAKKHSGLMAHAGAFRLELRQHRDSARTVIVNATWPGMPPCLLKGADESDLGAQSRRDL